MTDLKWLNGKKKNKYGLKNVSVLKLLIFNMKKKTVELFKPSCVRRFHHTVNIFAIYRRKRNIQTLFEFRKFTPKHNVTTTFFIAQIKKTTFQRLTFDYVRCVQ